MTTEIDAEGLAKAASAVDAAIEDYGEFASESIADAAIRAYLATTRTSEAEPVAQCCMCGKTGLSTVEGDGGTECQLSDGRWTCSQDCWERAVDPTPASDDQVEAVRDVIRAWEATPPGHTSVTEIQRWLVEDMKPAIDRARTLLAAMGSTKR